MAPSPTLPAELALLVLEEVHDLKALDTLRRTSRCFAEAFRRYGTKLIYKIMKATLHQRLVREMVVYARIATKVLGKKLEKRDIEHLYQQDELPATMSYAVLCHLLHTFSALATLTDRILSSCLSRLQNLPSRYLRHRQFPSEYTSLISIGDYDEVETLYRARHPAASWSWEEEQRLLLALWRAVNYKLLGSPRYLLGLPFKRSSPFDSQWDEFDFACECLGTHAPDPSHLSDREISWQIMAPRPCILADTKAYDRDSFLDIVRSRLARRRDETSWSHPDPWQQLRLSLRDQDADWQYMRRLGLGIWSARRVVEELDLKGIPDKAEMFCPDSIDTSERSGCTQSEDVLLMWKQLYMAALEVETGEYQGYC